jgi:hypothetical protein
MDTDGIKRRIGWLDELSRGLAKEVVLMKAANDPLLYLERKAYLTAIQDALAGVVRGPVTPGDHGQPAEAEGEQHHPGDQAGHQPRGHVRRAVPRPDQPGGQPPRRGERDQGFAGGHLVEALLARAERPEVPSNPTRPSPRTNQGRQRRLRGDTGDVHRAS